MRRSSAGAIMPILRRRPCADQQLAPIRRSVTGPLSLIVGAAISKPRFRRESCLDAPIGGCQRTFLQTMTPLIC